MHRDHCYSDFVEQLIVVVPALTNSRAVYMLLITVTVQYRRLTKLFSTLFCYRNTIKRIGGFGDGFLYKFRVFVLTFTVLCFICIVNE